MYAACIHLLEEYGRIHRMPKHLRLNVTLILAISPLLPIPPAAVYGSESLLQRSPD